MRRLYEFLLGIVAIILVLWGISAYMQSHTGSASDKLVIYNWGDYIDPDLLTKFTKETGIKVQYETFDSNEAMYTKIKQGGTTYDIAVPSDYTIDKMVKENLLVKSMALIKLAQASRDLVSTLTMIIPFLISGGLSALSIIRNW